NDPENDRLVQLNDKYCELIWEVISKSSIHSALTLVWHNCGETYSFLEIPNAGILERPDHLTGEGDPIYWKYYSDKKEWHSDFPIIWDSFEAVRIYPSKNENSINKYIEEHFFDYSHDKELGIGHTDAPEENDSDNVFPAIDKALQDSSKFLFKLFGSKDFRENLLNPFKNKALIELLRNTSAYACKGGWDNTVFLEVFTSNPEFDSILENTLKEKHIKYSLSKENKDDWSSYPDQNKESS
ncbi:MAG: hypothetical protein KC684_08205, partial [Candidatus Omnitrophica bacterium]|nr:hypothetical protein [Candidatus Omnitrophota bacterium]